MSTIPTLRDIREAHRRIAPYIHRTPVMTSRHVDERAGGAVFCKCDNLQRVGAFKIRGATNAVLSLNDEAVARGVATHSSGNHGAALARAAGVRGVPAYLVMPETASRVKIEAVEGYGGSIVYCSSDPANRQEVLAGVLADTGACLVHPFDDYSIIAGQGTAALELMEDVPDLDLVLAPVGGGGLLSGTSLTTRGLNPNTRVIGVEPKAVDDTWRSFRAGRVEPVTPGSTSIADGLLTTVGDKTFGIIASNVDDIVTVSESEIIDAMRFIWTRMKIVVEPSAAVPMAALFNHRVDAGGRIGVILSGGNVDLDRLPWVEAGV